MGKLLNPNNEKNLQRPTTPTFFGTEFPIKRSGFISIITDYNSINANLRLLLMTEPGERWMEPDFGVRLRDILFEPFSPFLESEAIERISRAIERFDNTIVLAPPGVLVTPTDSEQEQSNQSSYIIVSFKYALKSNLGEDLFFNSQIFRSS
jgi:phage baseplate assembly protein W